MSADGEEDPACGRCGKPAGEDVIWCPAWQESLCLTCRASATDAELRMTLEQKKAFGSAAS